LTWRRLVLLDVALLAFLVIARSLGVLAHEVLGHGLASKLLGASEVYYTISPFGHSWTQPYYAEGTYPGGTAERFGRLAGLGVDLLIGTTTCFLLRKLRRRHGSLHAFLGMFATFSFFSVLAYLVYGWYHGIGDSTWLFLHPEPESGRSPTPWLWILVLPATGLTGFLGTRELLAFLAGHFPLDTASRRAAFTLATVGTITGACVVLRTISGGGASGEGLWAGVGTVGSFVFGAAIAVARHSPPPAPRVELRLVPWLVPVPLAAGAIVLSLLMSDPLERQLGSENARACDELREGRLAEAATTLQALLETIERAWPLGEVRAREWRALVEYNLACACSVGGQRKEALDWFERAVGSGYRDWVWMDQDPGLDQIRHEPRFVEIQTRWRAKH
jgi:hypothetical protein